MKNILRSLSLGLLAGSCLSSFAHAACTNNPDCTALGYNKTSCPAGNLIIRCPFDTAKLKCIPSSCENIGKKTCGDMCIKSSDCCTNTDCTSGKVCNTADHICYSTCAVGDIFYNDKTCSPNLISGKTPIGVVGYVSDNGKNGLVVAKVQSSSNLYWATEKVDLSCINNISGGNGGANIPTYNPEVRADRNGKSNTACIMKQIASSGTGKYPAGEYCNGLNVEGVIGWHLPAGGELYDVIVTNLTKVNAGLSKISGAMAITSSDYHWSSSEYNYEHAWRLTTSGHWNWGGKNGLGKIQCVLAF